MKQEPLTGAQALEEGTKLPYALIRQLSRVQLGPVPEQMPVLSEILEARFFDGRQEICHPWLHGAGDGPGKYADSKPFAAAPEG